MRQNSGVWGQGSGVWGRELEDRRQETGDTRASSLSPYLLVSRSFVTRSPAHPLTRSPAHPFTRSPVHLAILFFLFTLLAGCARGAAPAAPAALDLKGLLAIRAPDAILAGEPALVAVEHAGAPDGLAVTLAAQGSYGIRIYQTAFASGVARFTLPSEDNRQSGLVELIARAGSARGEGHLEIRAGAPADPITPLVGPRSIAADGAHQTMMVAVPFDTYGNPVADATPVEFLAQHPGERLERRTVPTAHLVAWQWLTSGTRAGRTTVTVSSGQAHGPDATFEEVPSWPVAFYLSASPSDVPADGRQLVTLRTDVILDRFGNPMLDGTLVTFVAEVPGSEPRQIPAYTIDGKAEAQFQAPSAPGIVTVRATLYGVESRPLLLRFTPGPAVGAFEVAAQVNARDGFVTLQTGLLLGALGQFVPDGTPVHIRVSGPDGLERLLESEAEKGRATAELRLAHLASGRYHVEVTIGAGHGATTFVVQ